MIDLSQDPELAAAAAPLATPVTPTAIPAPAPTVGALPTVPPPGGGFVPLGSTVAPSATPAPVVATPTRSAAPPKNPTFGEKLHNALISNPLNFKNPLANVAVAGIDALASLSGPLSNVAAPEDSGMGVLAQTAKNIEAQKAAKADAAAKAQQQAFENARKTAADQRAQQYLSMDQQKNSLLMAQGHAALINTNRIAAEETDEFQARMQASADTLAKPYLDAGGEVIGHNVPDSELNSVMPKNPGAMDHYAHIQDGRVPVIDPKTGEQKINLDGVPVTQPTYSIVKIGPDISLSQQQADLFNKFYPETAGGKWQAGQKLSGQAYYSVSQNVLKQQAVALNVEKVQAQIASDLSSAEQKKAEARNQNMSAAEKEQNLRAASLFAKYLAAAGGDPVLGSDLLRRSKDAGSLGAVEQLFGVGTLAKLRAQNLTSLSKTITDDENQLNPTNPVAATMSDEDKANMTAELKAARAARNAYLGLHQNDPDQITQSVLQLDKVDPAKRSTTILGSKVMPDNAKIYLLRHYDLPIPPALLQVKPAQPAQPAQPAPAAQ